MAQTSHDTASGTSSGPSDLLRRRAAGADRVQLALVDGDVRFTYADWDGWVSAAAARLIALGHDDGARVALRLPTGAAFCVVYLAVLRAGLVAVPVNPAYSDAEAENIVADCGAVELIDVHRADSLMAAAPADDPARDRGGEALAALLYPSGAVGRARGAMLSARALLANLEQIAAVEPPFISAGDVMFVPLPLTHVFGLNAGLGMALHVGATVVLADRFDPGATLRTMAAERVTVVLGVPGQYAAWLAHPGRDAGFARVRFAMSGSATLGRGVIDGFAAAGVVVHDGYGLTEAAPVVAVNALGPDRDEPVPGSVGLPLPGVEVQLRDETGDPADDGDPGRIFLRGANLFSGYWPDGSDGPDADGWFGTGDVAVLDDDGRLRLAGRSAELVVVDGFNVYPAEVEAVLAAEPGVAEVAVVGVPDAGTGEAVHAYVVPAPGAELDPDELIARAATSLARFKVPSVVEIVAALPRTVTGKIMRWQLGRDQPDDGGDGAGG